MSKISRISRYFDGPLAQVQNKTTDAYDIAVFRKFPAKYTATYIEHTWEEGDTLAGLAAKYLNNPELWWRIMEINAEVADPFSFLPGDIVRVPYAIK
jgi:nucleoid-associated protein YgaU